MMKRWLCLLLALLIPAGMACHVFAASHPFTDVPDGAWYAGDVAYVYEHGLMAGTSATRFSPEGTMTRAMTVTVLHRLAGCPESGRENPFSDVSADAYYYDAVRWAVEQGITAGTSAHTFSPDDNVTREQLVTFLYRYAGAMDASMGYRLGCLTGFEDAESVSGYALVPFAWSVTNGIIAGTDGTHLSPAHSATRAQCAAILTRFDKWMAGK